MKRKNRYTFRLTFSKVMTKFYVQQDSVEEAIEYLKPHLWIMEQLYQNSLAEDIRLNEEFGYDSEPDTRSGEETYGYEDDEHILGQLVYISDRWNCSFRIRWMIDLVKDYKK